MPEHEELRRWKDDRGWNVIEIPANSQHLMIKIGPKWIEVPTQRQKLTVYVNPGIDEPDEWHFEGMPSGGMLIGSPQRL